MSEGDIAGSADRAVAAAAERAKMTAGRNIPVFDDLPIADTANLRLGADLHDALLALLPLEAASGAEEERRDGAALRTLGQLLKRLHRAVCGCHAGSPPIHCFRADPRASLVLQRALHHRIPQADAQRAAERGHSCSRSSSTRSRTLGRLATTGNCPTADSSHAGLAQTEHNPGQEECESVCRVNGRAEPWRCDCLDERLQALQRGNAHSLAALAAGLHLSVSRLQHGRV